MTPGTLTLYNTKDNRNRLMQRYDVICSAAPWENTTTDEDRAWDLCLDLSEEFGYAEVRQGGMVIGSYKDGSPLLW